MDFDNDIVSTSPGTSSLHGAGFRSQLLPPLPRVSELMAQSSYASDLPSASFPAQAAGPQRSATASARTTRNPSSTFRSLSLQHWVTSTAASQPTNTDQVVVVGSDSPRSEVISVDDNSADDIVTDSEEDDEEVVIDIDDDSDTGGDDLDEREVNDTGAGRPLEVDPAIARESPVSIDNENTDTSSNDTDVPDVINPETNRIPDDSHDNSITSVQNPTTSLPTASTSVPNPSATVPIPGTSAPIPSTVTLASGSVVQISTPETNPSVSSSPAPQVSRVLEHHNDSLSEFRSPKRKRILSPEKPAGTNTGVNSCQGEEEEEGDSCPICFEPWTTTGNHRLCSLKCGHLFGQSCIEKWLKGQGGKCPHCNAKAKRQDVRVLFAKTIKALDTSERDRALSDLEKERELRRKVEMETAQLRLQYQMSIEHTNKLRLEVETLKSQMRRSGQASVAGKLGQSKVEPSSQNNQLVGQFVLDKTIKIWEGGNCRVMAYSHSLATLVVSQPSSSQLFPGFGIKKISALDFKTSQYLTIHTKAIRDMAFHQTVEDGILLSCGLDKKVKMTSLISNAVVQSYDTPMPAWSCAWNGADCNYFYAGLQNGLVLKFDVRNTGEPVQELNKDGSRSPVASLVYVSDHPQGEFRSSGLLIGQLDRASFLQNTHQGERMHILPLEGSLTSLHVEQQTQHMLASYRPTARHPTIRHQLCELTCTNISANPTVINNVCSCNVVHTFHGGRTQTVLSKTLIQGHPGDDNRLLVCGGDENNNSVHIWDSGTGQLTQRLLADGVVVDLCKFSINNQQYLGALTDKQCKVFKWR